MPLSKLDRLQILIECLYLAMIKDGEEGEEEEEQEQFDPNTSQQSIRK